jgi:hypothetical protein
MENHIKTSNRVYWLNCLSQMAQQLLCRMSCGELKKTMPLEFSPIWDGRSQNVSYMETFKSGCKDRLSI